MKKTLLLLCTGIMLFLAACSAQKTTGEEKPSAVEQSAKAADTADGRTDVKAPVSLTWWSVCYDASLIKDWEKVLEKANAISAEKIGVTVDLKYKTEEQLNLDLNTGEYYDMVFSSSWCNDFDKNARNGYYRDLTDIVKDSMPGLYAAVDPWWEPVTVNGRIYGVPALKDLGAEVFFIMNQDFFEDEKGMKLPEQFRFEDLEEYLKVYREANPGEYPLYLANYGPLGIYQVHERIVSKYLVIPYRYAGTQKGTRVIPFWEDEEFMGMLRTLRRWYQEGYINPDASTNTEGIKDGAPIRTVTAWTGYKTGGKNRYGFDTKMIRYIGPNMSRATMQGANMAINAAADEEHVMAALKYIELLYTDREFRDLLAYGIEGEHFNYYNGTVIRTQTGTDNYLMDAYITGPVVNTSPVTASEDDPADPDMWKRVYSEYEHATISDTKGFSFDQSAVEAECTLLNEYVNTYWAELITGTVDPDEKTAEMKEQMRAMGLERVLEEAQRQLDEYLKGIQN